MINKKLEHNSIRKIEDIIDSDLVNPKTSNGVSIPFTMISLNYIYMNRNLEIDQLKSNILMTTESLKKVGVNLDPDAVLEAVIFTNNKYSDSDSIFTITEELEYIYNILTNNGFDPYFISVMVNTYIMNLYKNNSESPEMFLLSFISNTNSDMQDIVVEMKKMSLFIKYIKDFKRYIFSEKFHINKENREQIYEKFGNKNKEEDDDDLSEFLKIISEKL